MNVLCKHFGWIAAAVAVYSDACSTERHLPLLRLTAEARWQSGYAADCNSVYAGSIPTLASIFSRCPGGGIGRRNGLKIRYSKECAGSSPAPGTMKIILALPSCYIPSMPNI